MFSFIPILFVLQNSTRVSLSLETYFSWHQPIMLYSILDSLIYSTNTSWSLAFVLRTGLSTS